MFLQTIFVLLVLLYILWFYFENFGNGKHAPGPLRIPPFGNLIQIALEDKVAHIALNKLAKKYGDVMSIKMGLLDTIIFSSFEAAKQVLSKEEASGRLCSGFILDRNFGQQGIGLIFSEGPQNDVTRRFCRDTLKVYGYGNREVMRNMLLDEVTELTKLIENEATSNSANKVHFPSEYFSGSFLNIMSTWMMGKRFSPDDGQFQILLEHERDVVKNGVAYGAGVMMAYPFLRHIFPKWLGYDLQMRGASGFHDTGRRFLEERRNEDYRLRPYCFTDNFLQKMDEDSQTTNPLYTEKHFAVLFTDLLQAGTDTVSNVLNFTLLHLVVNENIQEKVFQEISSMVGSYRLPQIEDKLRMPYTQAVILEGLRWTRVAVFGVPRKATDDFSYRNYFIKKGTILMMNTHSIFFDEDTWGDPNVFRPERFIDLQGNIDPKKQEIVSLAFGTGKRICFGEVLGRDSLFIFITALIQKFKFSLPPGAIPNVEPRIGLALYAGPYDAIVTLREK